MTQPETMPPGREPSTLRHVIRGTIGAVIAASAGLAAVVIVGLLAWNAVGGPSGAIIAAAVGAVLGMVMRRFGDWPVRSLAGAVGGAVAGFFAVTVAEQSPPGSAEWAIKRQTTRGSIWYSPGRHGNVPFSFDDRARLQGPSRELIVRAPAPCPGA
jgi:outer membrane lipoprotein SlyB